MLRAEIQWRDESRSAGCLRIGREGYSHQRFDDYCKAATVFRYDGVIVIHGWDTGISTDDWRAMEVCFLRERMSEYVFERYSGGKLAHRCHKRWSIPLSKWIRVKDSAK